MHAFSLGYSTERLAALYVNGVLVIGDDPQLLLTGCLR